MVACERMFNSAIRKVVLTLTLAVMLMSICAVTANASASAIYQACSTGASLSGFSKADLESARSGVPADLDEYYACTAQIDAALVDKATADLPGGKDGSVKSRTAKLRNASVEDLTSAADRKKANEQVARETKFDASKPFTGDADPVISAAAGKTLASTAAPSTPIALVIGVLGLLLLLGADLAGRLGKMPSVKKILPGSDPRDGD